ncbi:MAG: NTP transferase domain-containing protein [Capsulimonadaceae bacterium]|nr:NTP transferase domain-containing protein [Capsulimonadaceae bacterium]
MSRTDDILDAIVLAGGRISGPYAATAKTEIKGLVPIRGAPVIDQILQALTEAPDIDRVCVVGPREVRDASTLADVWTKDEGSPVESLRAGIESLGSTTRRILVCSCDLPFASCNAIRQMIHSAPFDAEIAVPVISDWDYARSFPGASQSFIKLRDATITLGEVAIIDSRIVTSNLRLLARVFSARKSPIAMACLLGMGFTSRLYSGRVTLADIEVRASQVTQCKCRLIPHCSPVLAYDVNTLRDYVDARRRMRRRRPSRSTTSKAANDDAFDVQVVWGAGHEAEICHGN